MKNLTQRNQISLHFMIKRKNVTWIMQKNQNKLQVMI